MRAEKLVNPDAVLVHEGAEQVARLGHRAYVGGRWDEVGQAMRSALQPGGAFFATFIPRPALWRNPSRSNAFAAVCYRPSEIRRFGQRNGFTVELLGPALQGGQDMAVFRPANAFSDPE